jgi:hypothetical protein
MSIGKYTFIISWCYNVFFRQKYHDLNKSTELIWRKSIQATSNDCGGAVLCHIDPSIEVRHAAAVIAHRARGAAQCALDVDDRFHRLFRGVDDLFYHRRANQKGPGA